MPEQILRHYQEEAIAAVFREFETRRLTVLVAATGVCKTTIVTEIIRRIQP